MGADYKAKMIYGVPVESSDYLKGKKVVYCAHPEAKGKKFCPECGLAEDKRWATEQEAKPGWDRYGVVWDEDEHYIDFRDSGLGVHRSPFTGRTYFGYAWTTDSNRGGTGSLYEVVVDPKHVEEQVRNAMKKLDLSREPQMFLVLYGSW